jgi:hypothetical protein
MTGYELDDLALYFFIFLALGLLTVLTCWGIKEIALTFIDIHQAWSEAKLKRENIKLVQPTESGLLPVSRTLLDSGMFTEQVLTLIAQRIDAYRPVPPVPQTITFAPHYAYRNDQKTEGLPLLGEPVVVAPQDFWTLYTGGHLPSAGFLMGYNLEDGKPIQANWNELYSALIGGVSGSGKSTLVRNILAQSALQRGRFLILDKHFGAGEDSLGESLMPLRPCMIADVASQENQMVDALAYAKDVGHRRLSGQDKDHSPLIVVVDETTALLSRSGISEQLGSLLAEIAQETRKVGVYALCIGQNFSSSIMDTTIRNSFVSMLTCRTRKDVARIMSGNTEFGKLAETLKIGQALWMAPRGEMIRLAVPNTTHQHITLIGQTLSGDSVAPPNPVYPEETAIDAPTSINRIKTAAKLDLKAQRAIQMFMDGRNLKDIIGEAYGATSGEPYKQAVQTFMSVLREQLTHET